MSCFLCLGLGPCWCHDADPPKAKRRPLVSRFTWRPTCLWPAGACSCDEEHPRHPMRTAAAAPPPPVRNIPRRFRVWSRRSRST